MKKLSKVLALLLALVFVLSLAACGDKPASTATPTEGGEATSKPDKVYTFKIDYPNAETNPLYPVLVEWARRIGEESNGRLDMQIYSNGAPASLPTASQLHRRTYRRLLERRHDLSGVFSCTEVLACPRWERKTSW